MSTVNNGKFRNSILTITKTINGEVASGWPQVYNMLNAFGTFAVMTEAELAIMDQVAYSARLAAFLEHVQNNNTEFLLSGINVQGLSNGTDLVACPLPIVVPPTDPEPDPVQVTVLNTYAGMEPFQGGTYDNYLTWGIIMSGPVSQNTLYSFTVVLKYLNNVVRTEMVSGTVISGQSQHYSYPDDQQAIYIQEQEMEPYFGAIYAEVVQGSIQIG